MKKIDYKIKKYLKISFLILAFCFLLIFFIWLISKKEATLILETEEVLYPNISIEVEENINGNVDSLFSKVKIFCLINSSKKEIYNRAIHINATWAKRCNKYVFLTHQKNINLPFLDLNVNETRNELWNKWKAAFQWVFDNEINNYDYFLRGDDDAYFVMENLRHLLLPYNPNKPYYFGARFKFFVPNGYMSGGAGVILTKEALKRIVPFFNDPSICPQETSENDDLNLGICVQNLNITSVDTRDSKGRHRMLPWSPAMHFLTGIQKVHFDYLFYPSYKQEKKFQCCAENMISFHYVYNETLYLLEFLIYRTKLLNHFDYKNNTKFLDY